MLMAWWEGLVSLNLLSKTNYCSLAEEVLVANTPFYLEHWAYGKRLRQVPNPQSLLSFLYKNVRVTCVLSNK